MKRTTAVQDKKEATSLPIRASLGHTAVRAMPEYGRPSNARLETRFSHDFSQAAVRPSAPMVGQNYATSACPVFPRACPFGGACHVCPAQVQAKLKVNWPGDRYEREADKVAEHVVRMPETRPQRQAETEEEDKNGLQVESLFGQIMPSQTKRAGGQAPQVSPGLEAQLRTLRSSGQPLSAPMRNFFESRFGYDFSQVRVHTDARAAQMTADLNAQAFTHGTEMYFGAGYYRLGTEVGRELIAHELTHVVQQGGTRYQSAPVIQMRCGAPNPAPITQPVIRANIVAEANRQIGEHYLWAAEGQYPGVGEVQMHPALPHVARNTTLAQCVCAGKHSDMIVSLLPHGDPANAAHNASPQNYSWRRQEGAGDCGGGCGVAAGSDIWGEACEGHRHFDCGGLVHWCYNQAGYAIGRNNVARYQACDNNIAMAALQPGDLCYIGNHHVGIYVGAGNVAESRSHNRGVERVPLAGRGWTSYGSLF